MIRYVDQSYEIITPLTPAYGRDLVKMIEFAARICHQSEAKEKDVDEPLIHRLIKKGHMSMIEHGIVQVKVIVAKGIADEIIRHRMASYAQSSTRKIRYNKKIDVVRNGGWEGPKCELYDRGYRTAIDIYHMLLNMGEKPEYARGVLPIDMAVTLLITANLREWMHIFKQRTDPAAHPDLVKLMSAILEDFRANIPLIFDEKYRNYWS